MAKKMDDASMDETYEELTGLLENLDGVDLKFAQDLLLEYARINKTVKELGQQIQDEGALIEVEKGGKGNRHIEKVENPAFTTYNKATQRMAMLAQKISTFVHQGKDADEEDDDLAAFNRYRP